MRIRQLLVVIPQTRFALVFFESARRFSCRSRPDGKRVAPWRRLGGRGSTENYLLRNGDDAKQFVVKRFLAHCDPFIMARFDYAVDCAFDLESLLESGPLHQEKSTTLLHHKLQLISPLSNSPSRRAALEWSNVSSHQIECMCRLASLCWTWLVLFLSQTASCQC